MTSRGKQAIGNRIKRARIHRGMSQVELAQAIGMRGQSGISMIERGERAPSHDMLLKLCNVLMVDPAWILSDSSPPDWVKSRFAVHEQETEYDAGRHSVIRKMKARRESAAVADAYIDAPESVQDLVQLILFFHPQIKDSTVYDLLDRLAQDLDT